MSRQSQSAGQNSTQIQAQGDLVIEGVTEERAREIAQITANKAIEEFTEESSRIIQERILKLDDRLIAALVREGRLEVFTDPGFQRTYAKAQMGAAVSDQENDYDLLAGLLVDRASRGTTRNVKAGIERAVEVVDQIDDEALRGLTVYQAIQQHVPTSPFIETGLDALEGLLSDLLDGPLPEGRDWLDHLDILDSVRINPTDKLRPFNDFYPSQMSGYLATGIRSTSPVIPLQILGESVFGPPWLVDHELKPGYLRFAAATSEGIARFEHFGKEVRSEIEEQAKTRLGFGNVDQELVEPFMGRLRTRPTLSIIESWWDSIPHHSLVTGVGKVLARSNALRLDVRGLLPAID